MLSSGKVVAIERCRQRAVGGRDRIGLQGFDAGSKSSAVRACHAGGIMPGPAVKERAQRLRACGTERVRAHFERCQDGAGHLLLESETAGRLADYTKCRLAAPYAATPGSLLSVRISGYGGNELIGTPLS